DLGRPCEYDKYKENYQTNVCPTCSKSDKVIGAIATHECIMGAWPSRKVWGRKNIYRDQSGGTEFYYFETDDPLCRPVRFCKRDKTKF
ncbi:MAG TPA: hypothetical protein VEY71_09930, partial [Chitinophagales bacterium]|nr:hypothetical protein [Chitinophagales bacterium]